MPITQEILDANNRFYAAFANGSIRDMQDIWSADESITCIHPGQPSLQGRDNVLHSWRHILATKAVDISASHVIIRHHGDVTYVLCHEHLRGGTLIATNIFARETDGWRMIHHQAGPLPAPTSAISLKEHPTVQ